MLVGDFPVSIIYLPKQTTTYVPNLCNQTVHVQNIFLHVIYSILRLHTITCTAERRHIPATKIKGLILLQLRDIFLILGMVTPNKSHQTKIIFKITVPLKCTM